MDLGSKLWRPPLRRSGKKNLFEYEKEG